MCQYRFCNYRPTDFADSALICKGALIAPIYISASSRTKGFEIVVKYSVSFNLVSSTRV